MTAFSRTKAIALKYYCIPISNGNLYFLAKLFEEDITTRYAIWWKQCRHHDFAKNITWRKSNLKLLCHHGRHVSKANTNGNDADVTPEFSPLKTVDVA